MEIWSFVQVKLQQSIRVMVLFVVHDEGSSPGRQGFSMAVAADDTMVGSIGGGIMEFKLVERARKMLSSGDQQILLMEQHHDKESTEHQSGMICSGSQVNVFVTFTKADLLRIDQILEGNPIFMELSAGGMTLREPTAKDTRYQFQYHTDSDWLYTEQLNKRPVLHIVGGGHVSLALSELMCFLGFYSKVYDDRPELNTILQNFFANEKIMVPDYQQLVGRMNLQREDYVVVMTIGYRTDKIVLQQLLREDIYYLGMMGSKKKRELLFGELKEEGFSEQELAKVYTPIGIEINSITAPEIAVSIAAEIIDEKNKK